MASIEVTTLLAAIRQCVTVVGPGEVLAVRVPGDTRDDEMAFFGERAAVLAEDTGVRVLFFRAEEFAVLKAAAVPESVVTGEMVRGLQQHVRMTGGGGPDSVQRALGGAR